MRYFNYKVRTKRTKTQNKTKLNTPKITLLQQPPCYVQAVPRGEYQHYLKTLLYNFVVCMLNYRLNRKQHLNIQKKTQKTTTTEKPLRLKRALKSEEGMAGGRKTGHHVLPINTNTTFNSTASVLFCTTTHMRNVPRAHARHPVADNTLTLCCHTKSFRGACEQKKKKIS